MTPADAFLQAIIESPDDDTPRLVYADWLEGHGQPDRGALIRVQCQLALLPADDPRRPEREARERELLKEHEQEWVGPLSGCIAVIQEAIHIFAGLPLPQGRMVVELARGEDSPFEILRGRGQFAPFMGLPQQGSQRIGEHAVCLSPSRCRRTVMTMGQAVSYPEVLEARIRQGQVHLARLARVTELHADCVLEGAPLL
jgi:uncharacterized protein (TIGR02996 family)